jgi:hypothetical protein
MAVKKYTKNYSTRRNYNYSDPLNPAPALIQATGGTITTAGAYTYHTFTSNGTFTVTQGSYQEIDYFAIAGGGAAGRNTASGGNAGGGGAGGALTNWVGMSETDLYPYQWSQCYGPKLYTQAGDVWSVYVGLGGYAMDDNARNNSGGDTWLLKNGYDVLHLIGGGMGGGGTGRFPGGNGGCAGASVGAYNAGVNVFSAYPGVSVANTEVQQLYSYGRTTYPFRQGNGNYVMNIAATLQRANSAGGILSPSITFWSPQIGDLTRGGSLTSSYAYPGYGVKTNFGGVMQTYGNGGCTGTQYVFNTTVVPSAPTEPGSGGHGRTTSTAGPSGNGADGVVIFRYLTNKNIAAANVELLMVGGGGGTGGITTSPGAGGGGVIYYGNESGNTGGPLTLYNGTYGVTVGAGGVLSTSGTISLMGGHTHVTGIPCDNFRNYAFPKANTYGGFYALGGGSRAIALSEYVGSGNGVAAGQANTTFGLANPDHGKNGARNGYGGSPSTGAGGGGAGAAGSDAVNLTKGGDGGIGKAFSISGTLTYYGGGGGGARSTTGGTVAVGGLGGGANGVNATSGTALSGSPNTGGGGGGCFSATTGGSGGSGIVIIRYPNSYPAANGTTGSPTYANTGGWRTYTFTSSGTISFG